MGSALSAMEVGAMKLRKGYILLIREFPDWNGKLRQVRWSRDTHVREFVKEQGLDAKGLMYRKITMKAGSGFGEYPYDWIIDVMRKHDPNLLLKYYNCNVQRWSDLLQMGTFIYNSNDGCSSTWSGIVIVRT